MLLIILLIFSFRVVAQMVQYFHPVEALPQFEEWQSGVLPYPVLLLAQLIILFILVQTIGRYFRGSVRMGRKRGIVFLLGGGGYFLVMVARLLASVFFNKNETDSICLCQLLLLKRFFKGFLIIRILLISNLSFPRHGNKYK